MWADLGRLSWPVVLPTWAGLRSACVEGLKQCPLKDVEQEQQGGAWLLLYIIPLLFTLPLPTSVTAPLYLQPWDPRLLGRWDIIPPPSGTFCRRH